MGLEGPQSIDFAQNKTLAESPKTGVDIFLFEVFESGKYIYQGRVKLADKPYQSTQTDERNAQRSVWIFPLRLVDFTAPAPIPEPAFDQAAVKRERKARQLTEHDLRAIVITQDQYPPPRDVIAKRYESSEQLKALAKTKAKGKCMLCGSNAPFQDRDGKPYLEVHHIIWLSKGGPDTENNVVALCPNCHRKMHILDLNGDRDSLGLKAK
jgi:5-methylcytosine-specific restriction protein A